MPKRLVRQLFKIVGLITVFLVCCLFGFYKSLGLKSGTELTGRLVSSCNTLADRLCTDRREIAELVRFCFKDDWVTCKDGRFYASRKTVGEAEAEILDEMFSAIGMMDCESEYRRIKAYSQRLEEIYKRSLQKNAELGKLYKTLGISAGLFLVLFLI